MRWQVPAVRFHMNLAGSVRNAPPDPASSNHRGHVLSTIMIDERFGGACLAGLAKFSPP